MIYGQKHENEVNYSHRFYLVVYFQKVYLCTKPFVKF